MPFKNFGDLTTTIFIAASFLYLRIQPQPHPISSIATRNRRHPVGKIAAIRIPSPRARAQTPSQRQYRISIPPVSWSTVIIYGTGGRVTGDGAYSPPERAALR
jgi:hypothetical protein